MTAVPTTGFAPAEPAQAPRLNFDLPAAQEAHAPPPGGLEPGATRMLVAHRHSGATAHHVLADLPAVLAPGDLLVVNDSATLAAAVDTADGLRLHVSGRLPDDTMLVEAREPAGASSRPRAGDLTGRRFDLAGGGVAFLRRRWRAGRLWVAEVELPGDLPGYLEAHGQPIRYGDGTPAWPLDAVQTVFAREPGSAEAPSAALAFDRALLRRIAARGIGVATLTLHAGVASLEEDEAPFPEWFRVPERTARAVEATRASGGRVVAVGTTVTRALESAADAGGTVTPAQGWTELLVQASRGVRVIDGLLTGWHEPRASHLDLLEAVAGGSLLLTSYAQALAAGYRWHTFGDLHLVLP